MKQARKKAHVVLCLVALGFLLLHGGCGKKGPPKAPQAVSPPPVSDLTAEVVDNEAQLTWSVGKFKG